MKTKSKEASWLPFCTAVWVWPISSALVDWISRWSSEGNMQRRMYTTYAEPFRLRFIVRLPARPASQRCSLITLSVLCTFVRLILKQKQDGEELKLIQPNWLITSGKSFLYSLNVPWFPLPTRCPLPGRDKVCRLLSYLAYSSWLP